jgi:flagellum-specific ATP synthase
MTLAYHRNSDALHTVLSQIKQIKSYDIYGYVYGITGGIVLASGLKGLVVYGGVCFIKTADNKDIYGEVVGFEGEMTKILVSSAIGHIKIGLKVYIQNKNDIYPCDAWLGNVIDAFGNINQDGIISPLPFGDTAYPLRGTPPLAAQRRGFGGRLETQNPIFNSFLPICNGQRVGLFAGSGVGKSTLMSFFAKNIDADVVVIGLIGERGREVNDFIHKTLTPQMRDKCIIIAVSSDEAALIKRRGAYITLAVAEYFRDKGKNVVVMFDSLTRLAEAQREIGLMSGEPPAMRAFPPSAFSEVMALCERSGPGCNNTTQGDITAFFTVLVQGGDMDEPVADCVRGTLDGHIVLEREIAERGLYPAVNILKSISRSLPDCASADENNILQKTKRLLSEYKDVEPMVKLGVYKKGFAPQTDRAVDLYPTLEDFLYQSNVTMNTADTFSNLEQIITA